MGREATSRASTFSCVKREALLQDDRRKRHFVDCLRRAVEESTVEMHAWVVMRNHVHLLWTPRNECATAWLTRLKRRFVETLPDWPASGGGQFWQRGGGYDRIVWSQEEWSRQLRYIEANPVRAGLVDSAEHDPWCSAHDWRVAQRDWTPKLAAAPEGLVSLWWY
jgi:putative transposase